jgi:hypothetical protein
MTEAIQISGKKINTNQNPIRFPLILLPAPIHRADVRDPGRTHTHGGKPHHHLNITAMPLTQIHQTVEPRVDQVFGDDVNVVGHTRPLPFRLKRPFPITRVPALGIRQLKRMFRLGLDDAPADRQAGIGTQPDLAALVARAAALAQHTVTSRPPRRKLLEVGHHLKQ